ncbi:MAG: MBL fold metallo-hydrolase [Clostridia bacterium]|nr:MBL fold metallo-hydrolase [Clostridia bacterium]
MKLTFLGAAHEVTGSCTLLNAAGKNILIDCGMEQGQDIYENCELPILPADIDYIFLTHAHIDHSGKIPALVKEGYCGPIYATGATVRLCDIMLSDSAHIQEFEAQWRNRKAKRSGEAEYTPLYTSDDVAATMKLFKPCNYGSVYNVCSGISVSFNDAGHLLGSSSISFKITEKGNEETVVFSGDLGNTNRPLINDPTAPEKADILIIESTYGTKEHGERPDYIGQLTSVLQKTFDMGGNVVIPCFAIGRTQEMLYLLRHIKEQKLVKNHNAFPVYVDSPLAVEATGIYGGVLDGYYDPEALELINKGINPITFKDLRVSITSDDSIAINNDKTPKVILSSSGMCEAGRIRHHLKHNLWRSESTILFVGYQSAGTLGRVILDGAETVKLFGEEVKVRANIEQMAGISGHADKNIMLNWIKSFKEIPKTVFVNHGEDTVCDEFAAIIEEEFNIKAIAPYNGSIYLSDGSCVNEGNRQHIASGKSGKKYKDSSAFPRLLTAGKRLMAIIENYRNAANKDIGKFADQINSLIEKWK